MAPQGPQLEQDESRTSVGKISPFTVNPTHVFAFPRSGTTCLSEWLGKERASHEFNVTAVACLNSDVGKLDPLSGKRFLTAREPGLTWKTGITNNLFVFANRYIKKSNVGP